MTNLTNLEVHVARLAGRGSEDIVIVEEYAINGFSELELPKLDSQVTYELAIRTQVSWCVFESYFFEKECALLVRKIPDLLDSTNLEITSRVQKECLLLTQILTAFSQQLQDYLVCLRENDEEIDESVIDLLYLSMSVTTKTASQLNQFSQNYFSRN